MARPTVLILTGLALAAFAANSILCRLALRTALIDPVSFTTIRLLSGAVMLGCILWFRGQRPGGNWVSALALFAYAIGFSLAYVGLPAGAGALLLFGAVQVTMLGHGLHAGERLNRWQLVGLLLAAAGLAWLLWPRQSAPGGQAISIGSALSMLAAGIAWGIYSLRGKRSGDATTATAGNFMRTVPMALVVLALFHPSHADRDGVLYAIASGALASGIGYAIWYSALPALGAMTAGIVQLSVPILAAAAGALLLGEAVTVQLLVAGVAVIGGVLLALLRATPLRDRA
ncbi:MAG: hypothetical protein JWL98_515 [Xanthomonadaceae bacterium]|nr:hypothetical protein [Xanthomonadaceae bacterium]